MSKKAARAVISAVVLVGALTLLLFTTCREDAQYYKHVDEVMADPRAVVRQAPAAARLRRGRSIEKRPNTLDYRFKVKNGDAVVHATYTASCPTRSRTAPKSC